MNFLRISKNIFKNSKKTSKGSAGLPHNDPPNFKVAKNKRMFGINDHLLWFKDAYEQQYHVILKHNQYRGPAGMLWNIFRYYFLGVVVPVGFLILFKDYAHDSKNYYNAFFIESPTSPNYKRFSNTNYKLDCIRQTYVEAGDKDFLGRRGATFYHALGSGYVDAHTPTKIEDYFKKLQKTTPAGKA